jgi:hypothetical protein
MTPHITLDPNGSGALYCEHCLELHPPLLLCTVERWIDACRGFVLMHKHCPKPAEASPQLALPHTGAKPKNAVELRAGGVPTHVVTTSRANRAALPECGKHERRLTPPAFAEFLVELARKCRNTEAA